MGALMGFTEVKDDDGNPRWKCSCCPMQDRKLTGFSLVKHIQGKKHLEKHLTDQNSNQKDEILAVRWRLHQLLEDRKFFCQQIGLNPPMPDFNMEAIVRAEMQNDHDEIDGLEGGNNFALHGVQRLSDDCFLYRCQHCPEARITDPSKAFQHMTQNKFHAANLKRIKDARNASVADGESTDRDMDATGSGMASNLARRSASVDLGNSFAVREYGEKQTKKRKTYPGRHDRDPNAASSVPGSVMQVSDHSGDHQAARKPSWVSGAGSAAELEPAWQHSEVANPSVTSHQIKGQEWDRQQWNTGSQWKGNTGGWGKANWWKGPSTGKCPYGDASGDGWKNHGK
jgi:hypothetical protein